MNKRFKIITFITLLGIIGISFAAIIDDPAHIASPDPDCAICQAAQTQVLLSPDYSIHFDITVVSYINEYQSFDHFISPIKKIYSIRAPPCS